MKIKTEKDFNGYWLRGIKNFKGHEGEPLIQASVYKDGKRIGFYSDDSWGGPPQLHEFSKQDLEDFTDFARTVSDFEFEPWGDLVYQILSAVDFQRWVKRISKTKTIVKIEGEPEGTFQTLSFPYSGNEERVEKWLTDKYGEKFELILPV